MKKSDLVFPSDFCGWAMTGDDFASRTGLQEYHSEISPNPMHSDAILTFVSLSNISFSLLFGRFLEDLTEIHRLPPLKQFQHFFHPGTEDEIQIQLRDARHQFSCFRHRRRRAAQWVNKNTMGNSSLNLLISWEILFEYFF